MTRRRDFNPTPNETRHKRVNVLRDCVLKRQPVSGRIIPVSSISPLALGPALEHPHYPKPDIGLDSCRTMPEHVTTHPSH